MRTTLRGAAIGLCVATLAGCVEFSYISKTYVSLPMQVVTIGCNEPYEVYDQRQQRRMLIVSNGPREIAGCGAEGDPAASRGRRFREAARAYLDETVREDCRIGAETVFDELKREFVYSCPGPIEKPGTKVLRLPGRESFTR